MKNQMIVFKFQRWSYGLVLLLLVSLIVSGCASSRDVEVNEFVNRQLMAKSFFGELKSLGNVYNSYGATHILQSEGGENVFLKFGEGFTESGLVGGYVEVRGILAVDDKVKVVEVISVGKSFKGGYLAEEVKTELKSVVLDSTVLGLKVKYRNSFELKQSENGVFLEKLKIAEFASEVEGSPEGATGGVLASIGFEKIDFSEAKKLIGIDLSGEIKDTDVRKNNLVKEMIGDGILAFRKDVSKREILYILKIDEFAVKAVYRGVDDESFLDSRNEFYEMLNTLQKK